MNMKKRWLLWAFVFAGSMVSACSSIGLMPVQSVPRVTPSPTTRPLFTPRPSDTPWPTFTASPTIAAVTPGVISGVISATVNIRLGPGTVYPSVAKINKGARVNFRGRDTEGRWLFLVAPPNGWLNVDFVSLATDVTALPVVEAPATPAPTSTTAPTLTPAPTSTPPMYIDFRADAPWVASGQCTTLRWDVEGVRGVYVDGRGQPGHGSEQVCPSETRNFVLHVVLLSGYIDRAIAVTVIGTPPTAKP